MGIDRILSSDRYSEPWPSLGDDEMAHHPEVQSVSRQSDAFRAENGAFAGAHAKQRGVARAAAEISDEQQFIVVEPARVKVSRSHRLILKLDGTDACLFQRLANAVQREIILSFVACVGISHRPPDDDGSLERAKLLFCDLTQVPQENGNEVFNRILPSVNACSREKPACKKRFQ